YTPAEKQAIVNKNHKVTDKSGKEFFVEDFTIFEQDLPLDLFCHEFGYVLGLPDLYDTNKSEPPVENWSIMGGSYTGNPRGSQPVSYGAYCKEFLQKDFEKRKRAANWQNMKKISLDDVTAEGIDVVLDQATLKGKNKDVVRIDLPKYAERVVMPTEGSQCFFSGKGDKLKNYMTTKTPIELSADSNAKLTFKTWYDIDPYFDFASVQVREVGTDKWVTLKDETELTTDKVDPWIESHDKENILDRNPGWGFTDTSNEKWLYASFNLSQFKGKKFDLRFRFRTDDNTPEKGIYFDEIKIKEGSKIIFEDGAEDSENTKFNFDGFSINDGKERYEHYYLLEWRSSGAGTKVDKGLDTINMGAEGLSYETGLIMWYINGKYLVSGTDQDYNSHKGAVAVGVIDADQDPITYSYPNGSSGPDRLNYQLRDAAFSIRPDRSWLLDAGTYKVEDMHTFMNPIFKDSNDYTSPMWGSPTGLNLKNYGLQIFVTDESKDRSTAKIHIAKRNGNEDTVYAKQDADMIKEISISNGKIYITPKEQYSNKAYAAFSDLNGRSLELELKYENGKYVCDSKGISDSGLWKPEFIIFEDAEGNAKAVYNREANGIFGADLSKLFKKLEVEVDPEIKFNKGEKSNVSINVDLPNSVEEVTLLIGIYDEHGKMLASSIKSEKVNGKTTLTSEVDVPNEENMKIKIMLWDLKTMKVLQKEVVYNIK
ncbi:M6 family metalloprotease domain-containing protein, partial [Hathewaya proteolytica DSM 3090]